MAVTDLIVHFQGIVLLRPPLIDLADGRRLLGSESNISFSTPSMHTFVCRIRLERIPGHVLGLYSLTGRHPAALSAYMGCEDRACIRVAAADRHQHVEDVPHPNTA